ARHATILPGAATRAAFTRPVPSPRDAPGPSCCPRHARPRLGSSALSRYGQTRDRNRRRDERSTVPSPSSLPFPAAFVATLVGAALLGATSGGLGGALIMPGLVALVWTIIASRR